ncbi:hypothetical protein BG004_004645 [Podila humilis]|nr:hypothetical protein BG004_004645 [Podila humilis]
MSSSHFSVASSSSTSSPSFFPRPIFSSDLEAQKRQANNKNNSSTNNNNKNSNKFAPASPAQPPLASSPSTPSTTTNNNKSQGARNSHQYLFGTGNSSMMDLSAKLGELPTIQLPDFHLPDLHRLKLQLYKRTPSFSLKSLQHTFQVPSYTSAPRRRPSSVASREDSSRNGNKNNDTDSLYTTTPASASSANPIPTLRDSENKSQAQAKTQTQTPQLVLSSPEPIAIPSVPSVPLPHPSNYLVRKNYQVNSNSQTPNNIPKNTSTNSSSSNGGVSQSSSPIVFSTTSEISAPFTQKTSSSSNPTSLTSSDSSSSAAVPSSSASSKSPVGHLFLQIIEARNLTLVNPQAVSRPYCLVEYDQNELITPSAIQDNGNDIMGRRRGATDIFARAMAASSPKWRHDVEFDVVRPNQQISVTIYDSVGDDIFDPTAMEPAKRFLGQVRLKPSEIHDRMIDSWFRLQGREDGGQQQVTGEIRVTIKYQAIESRHLSTADFDILRVLGIGSFGKVYQVRKKDTGRIYAMKVLNKKRIIEQKQVEHTIAERNVLVQALQSPFIVGLKFSFQTPTKLYLVQDFMNGGELFFHMQNEGTFSEARARFYTAELVLALEHLHACNVVYRDLKPENILLSSQGHIVLVDFGLCKQNVTEDERTYTFCGTTEYLAPEIVKGTGYGKAVDWWSLGVLLYEMLVGASPFSDTRTEGTYHKILHQPVIFPSRPGHPHHHFQHTILKETKSPQKKRPQSYQQYHHQYIDTSAAASAAAAAADPNSVGISGNAQDLIQRFLDKNPKTRLGSGSGSNGAEAVAAIKAHPFFNGIDFVRLQNRDVTPPFQPHVGVMGDLDVSNFDAHFTDQTATLGMNPSGKNNNSKGATTSHGSSSGSSSSGALRSSTTLMEGEAGAFLLQQQQRAANLYRQQQLKGDNSRLNPNVTLGRGRRSSNSWCSYRTPSTDSLFILSEPSSPALSSQMQSQARPGGTSNQKSVPPHRARALQEQEQQHGLLQQQKQQQEFFKGFTFEGESILETLKRQEEEGTVHTSGGRDGGGEEHNETTPRSLSAMVASEEKRHHGEQQRLFSGDATSVDSIFGSM